MGPLFVSLLFYHLSKKIRDISNRLVGNYFEPEKDTVLITGGCSGLGKELVNTFAATRAKVVVLDIVVPTDEEQPENVYYYKCDVSDRKQVLQVHKTIKKEIGNITVLINNAGITTGKPLVDLSYHEIEKTIQINLMSSFYTIKVFLPSMLRLHRGYIVTIASVLGYMSPARLSAYGASKSGLIALHESLTYELGPPSMNPTGVKTLLICPGQLKTAMFSGVNTPSSLLAPELDPKYVASSVLSALELGRRGEIKLPLYGNFLPMFRAFPWPIVEVARAISGIDHSMNSFKNTLTKVASTVSTLSQSGSKNSSEKASLLGEVDVSEGVSEIVTA
ncbi:predicted protein [Scheffersomyces stipitis CBS 6054]|uniref:Short-chain dehydrogenase/reductase 3 n=1 Tax=Scheffersomyces stipitis (strain ATCC 58785 / CBS 6054 / NBRC 10063 / NRRL Y-11545) TaxID=322104 RepID=A3LWC2_PICST|nr:predicted protein [Scheffersomyces stipitis CBS 6054]ABN67256.2 predicted protein [Scheffersomyces stipitis CBS 6054]KAG2734223.1 hypothetical protein G9P44_002229 [Scheffersomyces stipitis]